VNAPAPLVSAPPRRPAPVRVVAPAWRIALSCLLVGAGVASSLPCPPAHGGEPATATRGPVLVVGVDGLEWDVILPMLRQGRLPHLSALMRRGTYGELRTIEPTLSPVVWTSVATGKVREKHGIDHFVRRRDDGSVELLTSADRRTKALWNILSENGRTVAVIGWWMTYPVERVAGVMVAQTNTAEQARVRGGGNVWKGALRPGVPRQVHPPAREEEMLTVLGEVDASLPALSERIFGAFPHPLSRLGERLWRNCQWAFRADATYLRIALRLARERPPADLTLLYLGGPDVVGHRFWRYMDPAPYRHPPTSEERANFGTVIPDYYAYVDEALGALLDAHGAATTVLVVSDHGMHPVNRGGRFDPDDPPADVNSAHHYDAPPGVLVAAGPPIRRNAAEIAPAALARADLDRVGSVLDIAPTILALMRLPVGADMDGSILDRLLTDAFRSGGQPPAVATHDDPDFLAGRGKTAAVSPGEDERLEQLRSLGYLAE
jgi:hypothetical protein